MDPAFPLLCLHEEEEPYCYLVEGNQELNYCNLYGYYESQRNPALYFDASGKKVRRKLKLKRSFGKWQKLLSYFYWGKVPVESTWYQVGEYELAELKEWVLRCIKADDDVLTQFIEKNHLIRLLKQARHFEDIYMVLQNAIYNFEDDDSLIE
ncbi:hypothetical protein [Hymenobacter cavernae]|uniref:IPExxxVDY family protein n=1 Tax=Hymenobacter cavernae TaxID=2044852 RepID=A0ABQ1UEK9_9BACT|nr:hypothetical protein [Hymenobacter cavernae]GGF17010.1 hypothetical protein GCM10011383_30570 [Hymenobacter cavernae]